MLEQIKQALENQNHGVDVSRRKMGEWLRYLLGEVLDKYSELELVKEELFYERRSTEENHAKYVAQYHRSEELQKALETVRATLEHKKNDDRTSWGLWDVANKAIERS
jgi:hypothetical protein